MKKYSHLSAIDRLLLEHKPLNEIQNSLEELAKTAYKCIAKFITRIDGDPNRFRVIGTGFCIDLYGVPCLLSAAHVFETYNLGCGGCIAIEEDKKLIKTTYAYDTHSDVGCIDLSGNVAIEDGIFSGTVRTLRLFTVKNMLGWKTTSTILILGFPTAKNTFDQRKPKSTLDNKFQYFSHSFSFDEDANKIEIPYDNALTFLLNSEQPAKLPIPEGLSGSPAMMVVFTENVNEVQFGLRVVGIVKEWNTTKNKLIIHQIGDSLE